MNIEEIKKIFRTKTRLTVTDIQVLTGCSQNEARALRMGALQTYLPITEAMKIRTKVRLDKFLKYYDDENLQKIYDMTVIGTN